MKTLLGTTSNGVEVYLAPETIEHMKAHSDVKLDDVKEAISLIEMNSPFFMDSVVMPDLRTVGYDHCIVRPKKATVQMLYRKGRKGTTPVVFDTDYKAQETYLVTVGICLDDDGRYTLFTAFYGQLAPKEPWDNFKTDAEKQRSEEFWATHCLVCNKNDIDWRKKDNYDGKNN